MIKRLLLCVIIYFIDLLLVTPYAIAKCGLQEAGLLNSFGYDIVGILWFPLWGIIFMLLLHSLFKWIKSNVKRSNLVITTITITFCALMLSTIIHNLMVIREYC